MRKFTADFETTVDEFDCRVWAYSICEIGNVNNFIYGNNIDDFIKWCSDKKENYVVYFHNLKFDSQFVMSYLFNNGYTYISDETKKCDKSFTTLIGGMGEFYSLEIYFNVSDKKRPNKVTIYDSLKILNFSVDKIAKSFDLPIRKLDLDYKAYREVGHILTDDEIAYIRNDVEIMARALEIMFNEGLTKMTIGSNALSNYKKLMTSFTRYFPELDFEVDQVLRQSYRGGFTYVNPKYKGLEVGKGIVLDVNSLYPSVMVNDYLPIGEPVYYDGEYINDSLYPLYICIISCSFKLKEGKIPTIQIKKTFRYNDNEYIESSNGEIETLCLTSVDYELFREHYEVDNITFECGWKFKKCKGLFTGYINHWTNEKIKAKKENNSAKYQISKLMLNSLYGKFGKNPRTRTKIPFLGTDGIIHYELSEESIGKSCYIPVASFITSYARLKTISTSQLIRDYTIKNYGKDYYLYSDTDSIHMLDLPENELKQFVEIDDYNLGWWKLESKFKRGKFIRQKCYIEEDYDNNINATIAGLPKKLGKYVNFDNFNIGFSVLATELDKEHKLTYKHVKGGVILVDTDYSIK